MTGPALDVESMAGQDPCATAWLDSMVVNFANQAEMTKKWPYFTDNFILPKESWSGTDIFAASRSPFTELVAYLVRDPNLPASYQGDKRAHDTDRGLRGKGLYKDFCQRMNAFLSETKDLILELEKNDPVYQAIERETRVNSYPSQTILRMLDSRGEALAERARIEIAKKFEPGYAFIEPGARERMAHKLADSARECLTDLYGSAEAALLAVIGGEQAVLNFEQMADRELLEHFAASYGADHEEIIAMADVALRMFRRNREDNEHYFELAEAVAGVRPGNTASALTH